MTDKKFSMTDLIAEETAQAKLTPTCQAGERQATQTRTAKPGRLKPSPRQVTAALTSGRAAQQAARAYAEVWLQALRAWRTFESEAVKIYQGPSKTSRMRVVGVGSFGSSASMGGSGWATTELVSLPSGAYASTHVGLLCNTDPLLSELRRGAGLATLIHASGRGWAGQRAREYGAAVLQLAVALGVTESHTHLCHLLNAGD